MPKRGKGSKLSKGVETVSNIQHIPKMLKALFNPRLARKSITPMNDLILDDTASGGNECTDSDYSEREISTSQTHSEKGKFYLRSPFN